MARMQLNEQEEAIVKKGRELAQLKAKRRSIAADLKTCDDAIAKAGDDLRALTPSADLMGT